jgi:hypothetical protein
LTIASRKLSEVFGIVTIIFAIASPNATRDLPPQCMLDAVKVLLPTIDYSRVRYYVGFETRINHGQAATTLQYGDLQRCTLRDIVQVSTGYWSYCGGLDTRSYQNRICNPPTVLVLAGECGDTGDCSMQVLHVIRSPFAERCDFERGAGGESGSKNESRSLLTPDPGVMASMSPLHSRLLFHGVPDLHGVTAH